MSEKILRALPGALLFLSGAIWIAAAFFIDVQVNTNLRRELSGFNARLSRELDAFSPESEFVTNGQWNRLAFEGRDDQAFVKAPNSRNTVIRGNLENETFEEMSARLRKSLLIPVWPAFAQVILGIILLSKDLFSPTEIVGSPGD